MNTNLQIFEFESQTVRTVEIDGVVWFVAKDVAATLGYRNTRDAINSVCRKAKSLIDMGVAGNYHTLDPQTKLIPESDIYRLIFKSDNRCAENLYYFLKSLGFNGNPTFNEQKRSCKKVDEVVNEKPKEPFVKQPFMRHHRTNQYSLYVVLFDHGVIKVGKGENALKRVNEHAKQARIFGRKMIDFFIEENPRITEEDLIRFCNQNGTLFDGNEYFLDLDYNAVVSFLCCKVECKVLKLVR